MPVCNQDKNVAQLTKTIVHDIKVLQRSHDIIFSYCFVDTEKYKLGNDIELVVRCEHDAVTYGPSGELAMMNVKSLNEWDSRVKAYMLIIFIFEYDLNTAVMHKPKPTRFISEKLNTQTPWKTH